jgi:hypothetical protein
MLIQLRGTNHEYFFTTMSINMVKCQGWIEKHCWSIWKLYNERESVKWLWDCNSYIKFRTQIAWRTWQFCQKIPGENIWTKSIFGLKERDEIKRNIIKWHQLPLFTLFKIWQENVTVTPWNIFYLVLYLVFCFKLISKGNL